MIWKILASTEKMIKTHTKAKLWIWILVGMTVSFLVILATFQLFSRQNNPVISSIPLEMDYQAGYEVIHQYPHDPQAFTQGLLYHDGYLYESTGLRGHSSLRKVELETGIVLQEFALEPTFFAEGLTLWQEELIQLTWQDHTGFVYDLSKFSLLDTFPYTGEGWGLTNDGTNLVMSDGTSILYFLNPEDFLVTRSVNVTDQGVAIERINELEFIRGEVFANIWQTNNIARIDPATGVISGWINLEGLLPGNVPRNSVDVLNGIAYDPHADRLFVTGKLWPYLFEIRLVSLPAYP